MIYGPLKKFVCKPVLVLCFCLRSERYPAQQKRTMMVKLALVGLLLLALLESAVANVQIISPFPDNKVVVEGESMEVSCSAKDSTDYPTIIFKRSLDGITYDEVKPDNRISNDSTHRNDTENGNLITKSVLRVSPVQPGDDKSKGQWYCFAVDKSGNEDSTAFTVHLILKSQLPRGTIRGAGTLSSGDAANITCDITDGAKFFASLQRVYWEKDMIVLKNGTSATSLDPIMIKSVSMKDGGLYVCSSVVELKSVLRTMVLDQAMVNVQLKIDNGTTSVKGVESRDVVMECPADAYPLNVTWMRVNNEGQRQQLESNERYLITRPCESCRYRMTIKYLQPRDFGHYICVATSNMESGIHHFRLGPEENPTIGSSAVRNKFLSFLVLITCVVTRLLL